MKTFEGKLVSQNVKVGIVAARFNEFITSKLLSGAMDGLLRHDVQDADIHVAWVPGAFEIPLVASKMAKSGKYDAVICLGAVIRGSTSHYDYVCNEVSKGIATVSLESGVPVLFGASGREGPSGACQKNGGKSDHADRQPCIQQRSFPNQQDHAHHLGPAYAPQLIQYVIIATFCRESKFPTCLFRIG